MILLALVVVLVGLRVTIAGWRREIPSELAGQREFRDVRALLHLAPAAAALAALYLLIVPSYDVAIIPNYGVSAGMTHTLLEVNGFSALLPLLLPVLLASMPVILWRTHPTPGVAATVGTLLAIFSVLGGFSIGMFFLPSAILLIAAAFSALRYRDRTT